MRAQDGAEKWPESCVYLSLRMLSEPELALELGSRWIA